MYQVVVFGSTGFTGKLVCEHLLTYGEKAPLRWAMAGRSMEKLVSVRAELAERFPSALEIPIEIADSSNHKQLLQLCEKTSVVLTTVGPYNLYGEQLVRACAETGTDYCDLTGEALWISEMIAKYDAVARKSGARIVHCCGFDSIPSDLGVLVTTDDLRRKHDASTVAVRSYVTSVKGGVSGGTIASVMTMLGSSWKALKKASNPYLLCGGGRAQGVDSSDTTALVAYEPRIKRWASPFVMAAINAKIVRRSNELLGFRYGSPSTFSYKESSATYGGFVFGGIANLLQAIVFYTVGACLMVGRVRSVIGRYIKPGEGPSRKLLETGHCRITLVGTGSTTSGQLVTNKVNFQCLRDPGYMDTAVMLAESARLLADTHKKSTIPGCIGSGIGTPASVLGLELVARLQNYRITWTVV